MAVGPQGVASRRRAAGVDQALLGHEHVRPLGVAAAADRGLGRGDLGEGAADVHGTGPAAFLGQPRHRGRERVVDLEHARAVPVAAERRPVAPRQLPPADREELARRHVEEHGPRPRQVGHRSHLVARCGSHLPASAGGPPSPRRWPGSRRAPRAIRPRGRAPAARARRRPWADGRGVASSGRPCRQRGCGRRRPGTWRWQGRLPRASPTARTGPRAAGGEAAGGRPERSRPGRPSCAASGPTSAAYASPSRPPRPAAVSFSDRCRTAARPPSSGWAACTCGSIISSPCAASGSVRRNGEPTASGWIAEHTSWR